MLRHLKITYWVLLWLLTVPGWRTGWHVWSSWIYLRCIHIYRFWFECITYGVRFAFGKHPCLDGHKYHRHMSYTVYPQKFKHFNGSETHQIKKFRRNASRAHVLCNDPLIRSAEKYLSSKPCFIPEKQLPLKQCYRKTWGRMTYWTISVSQLPRNAVACIQLSD